MKGRLTSKLVQRPPSRHHTVLSRHEDVRVGGQTDRLDVRGERDRCLQLQDGDIVVCGLRAIVWGHYKPFDVYHFRRGLFTTDLCGPHKGRPVSGVLFSEHRDKKRR